MRIVPVPVVENLYTANRAVSLFTAGCEEELL